MKSIVKAMMLSCAVAFGLGINPSFGQHDHSKHEHGAQEHGEESGHSHERAEGHGGVVTMSKEFHVETVFMPDQVRLYLYDSAQNPIHVKHWKKGLVEATGTVDFRDRQRGTTTLNFVHGMPNGYVCPMHTDQIADQPGKCTKCGMNLVKQDVPKDTLWVCPMHPDKNGKAAGKCDKCGMKYMPQDFLVATAELMGLKAGGARFTINMKNLPGKGEQTLRFTEKYAPGKMHMEHGKSGRKHGGHGHSDHDH